MASSSGPESMRLPMLMYLLRLLILF
jgi:hypothetical protein